MTANNPRGAWKGISPARKVMNDLMQFAQRVPSVPVARTINVKPLEQVRLSCSPRPSWTAIFLKAYGIIALRHEELRTAYVKWPMPHFYVHPINIAGVAIEKEYKGERMVLHTQIRSPENSPLLSLGEALRRYKDAPVTEIGYYRRALRTGRLPYPLRWFLWWTTLDWSGYKKSKRIGTFGLTSYGRLGAEQVHPIGPLSTTLTFGPISNAGDLVVKVIYDHRVTDGAQIARYLKEFDELLQDEILSELKSLSTSVCTAA